jgi:hypothetical protein
MFVSNRPRSGRSEALADLEARLREQEHVAGLIRAVSATVSAPPELRERLDAKERRQRRRPRGPILATAAAAVAAFALVLLLVLPEARGGPTAAAAAALSHRSATRPAPMVSPGQPKLLALEVGGVAFPAWNQAFGWRAAGARTDSLDGRRAATVYYVKNGRRLGYTIVDGAPLEAPATATTTRRAGTSFQLFDADGRVVVTWLRGGRTCVLAARGVSRDTLLKLAGWRGAGAVAF